jgi:hypothetical protein
VGHDEPAPPSQTRGHDGGGRRRDHGSGHVGRRRRVRPRDRHGEHRRDDRLGQEHRGTSRLSSTARAQQEQARQADARGRQPVRAVGRPLPRDAAAAGHRHGAGDHRADAALHDQRQQEHRGRGGEGLGLRQADGARQGRSCCRPPRSSASTTTTSRGCCASSRSWRTRSRSGTSSTRCSRSTRPTTSATRRRSSSCSRHLADIDNPKVAGDPGPLPRRRRRGRPLPGRRGAARHRRPSALAGAADPPPGRQGRGLAAPADQDLDRPRAPQVGRERHKERVVPNLGSEHVFDGTASRSAEMPRRDDIRRICVLGSGPIVIGQACEFDYSAPRRSRRCAPRATRWCSSTRTRPPS